MSHIRSIENDSFIVQPPGTFRVSELFFFLLLNWDAVPDSEIDRGRFSNYKMITIFITRDSRGFALIVLTKLVVKKNCISFVGDGQKINKPISTI